MDPRHQKRIKIIQELYSSLFNNQAFLSKQSKKVLENQSIIDKKIISSAPKYPIEKIAKIDLSIIRLAIFELIIERKEPPKVIINEAIELAKEFSSERSPGFVNAVLGKIYDEVGTDHWSVPTK
jgi:N utilization substance protein B